MLNITATDGTGVGYVTVYPCGAARPEASSLNFDTSSAAPNTVIAAIGAAGKVCLYTAESSAHLIADTNGYVGANSGYLPLNPARLADSRAGRRPPTDSSSAEARGLRGPCGRSR